LNKVRRERDNGKLERAKRELGEVMKAGENMIPPLIEAVKCGMTQGEYGKIRVEVYKQSPQGCYTSTPPLALA
jgi:methylmalonyl-CoA mutase N-terminal domain/subunit